MRLIAGQALSVRIGRKGDEGKIARSDSRCRASGSVSGRKAWTRNSYIARPVARLGTSLSEAQRLLLRPEFRVEVLGCRQRPARQVLRIALQDARRHRTH